MTQHLLVVITFFLHWNNREHLLTDIHHGPKTFFVRNHRLRNAYDQSNWFVVSFHQRHEVKIEQISIVFLFNHFKKNEIIDIFYIHSKTYQTDECFNCGAALEDNNLFIKSSGTSSKKSSTAVSVRCRQCLVCESTNVILEKFRAVISSSPRSIPIQPTGIDATNQFSQKNHFIRHHMRTKSSFETPAINTTVNTFAVSSSSFVENLS